MTRRLALTCGTMLFNTLGGFVIMSLSVAMFATMLHEVRRAMG